MVFRLKPGIKPHDRFYDIVKKSRGRSRWFESCLNGATILVNSFPFYTGWLFSSSFKPIIASIKWKVSNNEGIIVARLVISILGSHSRCITADIVAFDGERWSSSVSWELYFYRSPERRLATKSRRVERQEIDGQWKFYYKFAPPPPPLSSSSSSSMSSSMSSSRGGIIIIKHY